MKKPKKPRRASAKKPDVERASPVPSEPGSSGRIPPSVPATTGNFKRTGHGIEFRVRVHSSEEGPMPEGFDPWTFTSNGPADILSLPGVARSAVAAAGWIQQRREKIVSHGPALLQAVAIVAKNRLVMPEWMAVAYLARYQKIERMEGGLDEAFGPLPFKVGKRLDNLRRRRQLIPKISRWLIQELNAHPERAIEKDLFAEAGAAFGIGGTQAYELYREGVEKLHLQDINEMKEFKLFPFKR